MPILSNRYKLIARRTRSPLITQAVRLKSRGFWTSLNKLCGITTMKKVALLGLGGLMFVSAAANAISFNGSAGEDYTHLGFGLGTETSGLAMTGGWTHNDDDGDAASLGLGLNRSEEHTSELQSRE